MFVASAFVGEPLGVVLFVEVAEVGECEVEPGGFVGGEDEALVDREDALQAFAGGEDDDALCEDGLALQVPEGEVDVRVVGDVQAGAFLEDGRAVVLGRKDGAFEVLDEERDQFVEHYLALLGRADFCLCAERLLRFPDSSGQVLADLNLYLADLAVEGNQLASLDLFYFIFVGWFLLMDNSCLYRSVWDLLGVSEGECGRFEGIFDFDLEVKLLVLGAEGDIVCAGGDCSKFMRQFFLLNGHYAPLCLTHWLNQPQSPLALAD